jgi:hypothetical protein
MRPPVLSAMASVRVSRQARHHTRLASKRVNAANAASGGIDRLCAVLWTSALKCGKSYQMSHVMVTAFSRRCQSQMKKTRIADDGSQPTQGSRLGIVSWGEKMTRDLELAGVSLCVPKRIGRSDDKVCGVSRAN